MTGPILVPLALSAAVDGKIAVVEQQARALDTDVVLLHVLRQAPFTQDIPQDGLVATEEAMARTYLDTVALVLRARGMRARSLVRRGPLGTAVGATAAQHRTPLIVVGGSPPRTGLRRLVRRGAADEIARTAPCPVLVVTPEQDEAGPGLRTSGTHLRRFDVDAARCGPLAPYALGSRTVELSRVIGTVPALVLGPDFRPVSRRHDEEDHHKLLVKQMAAQPEQLAPPELYKLAYGYYVFAGHAQLAAAYALGQTWIDATVTEYVQMGDAEARHVLSERTAFERATGLAGIGAALPGTYVRLRELIDESRGADELRLAAARWKASIFRPAQRRLRELRLNQHFPGERSADIVVRLAAHRDAEARASGRDIYWDEALRTFAARSSTSRADEKGAQLEPGEVERRDSQAVPITYFRRARP